MKYRLKRKTDTSRIITHQHFLSASDRVTYSYKIDNNTILEVVNVSYDIEIDNKWITIVHFDSTHGKMHCHMGISFQDSSETVTSGWIVKRGNPRKWLSWAMKDIRKRYLNYRVGFFKRSGIKNLY